MSDNEYTNDSMLELYLFESTSLLDQLDGILLQSEHDKLLSQDSINEIFRIMHTIKGSSAMMAFNTIAEVSHKLEDLFFVVRDKGIPDGFFDTLFDLVLKVSDFLKTEVEKIQQGQELIPENPELIDAIKTLLAAMKGETSLDASTPQSAPSPPAAMAAPAAAPGTAPAKEQAAPAEDKSSPENGETHNLHIYFTEDCQMENLRAFMLATKLKTVGEVLKMEPSDVETNSETAEFILQNGFFCQLATSLSQEEIEELAKSVPSVDTVNFISAWPSDDAQQPAQTEQAPSPEQAPPEAAAPAESAAQPEGPYLTPAQPATPATASVQPAGPQPVSAAPSQDHPDTVQKTAPKQNLINVDLNKLDSLMELVGEIVITESMVSGSPDLEGLELENFQKAARQLRKLTESLQDIVMSVRMVPISGTFQKMRRIVRDMGKQLNKEVELTLIGETTEVDKTIIDAIGDPLMHLVRNSMDHAIESREERIAAGKNPVGNVTLSAENIGGDIVISVSDDGKGLDASALLAKAAAKGLLIKPESEYTDSEAYNLIMVAGFSTKEVVTEFSGRGVGMDVVKKNIEKIGGTVNIESAKGKGTTILFKIPLTLAIISSMEIAVGGATYAVPINNIRESFKVKPEQIIRDPDGNEMIMIRGAAYPVIRLCEIFHLEDAVTDLEEGILLLVDSGERVACLLADKLLGKHQIVVKALPSYLSWYNAKAMGIAGCTILGDGSISLIIDVQGVLSQH